jgi:coenzyme F420-reducing hydrogenase beta subunit
VNAIKAQEDSHGFLHPIIDSCCISCGACEKVCPILKEPSCRKTNSETPEVLAGWHKNMEVRIASSSGGAFTALAEAVIGKQGVVYGAGWGENLRVVHKRVETPNELDDLRKSKYVQSEIGDTYKMAKKDLAEGRTVLFVGTPCQIAGLYTFLHDKTYENLYTVDFVCHGVPSNKVFQAYIKSLEDKMNDRIVSVNFRDKSLGVGTNLCIKVQTRNTAKYRRLVGKDISYYRGFIGDLFLRDCCYACTFNNMPRVADISLADYIGLGDRFKFKYEKDRIYGFTGITINNAHGKKMVENSSLMYDKRSFEEFSDIHPSIHTCSSINPSSESFYRDLDEHGFAYTAEKYMNFSSRGRIDLILRRCLGVRGFYSLGKFVKKYILKTRTVIS